MEYARVEIFTAHERPDLRVDVDGIEIGVEVTEATESAQAQATILETNMALQAAITANPSLAPPGIYVHITRAPGRGTTVSVPRQDRGVIVEAIVKFLQDGSYVQRLDDQIKTIHDWPGRELGYVAYISKHRYEYGRVKFDASACTFDPSGMVQPILEAIADKRELAAGYDFQPLWLVVGVTEPFGSYAESITDLSRRSIEIAPFDRVVVHDGGTFLMLSSENHAD